MRNQTKCFIDILLLFVYIFIFQKQKSLKNISMEIIGKYLETHPWQYIAFATLIYLYAWHMGRGKHYPKHILLILLLAYCYPLGEFFQCFYIVPRWIRFHLSDFGVIFMGVFLYATYAIPPIIKLNITKIINFSVFWFVIMVFHEYVEFQTNKGKFHGDWYDILAYTLAECIVFILLFHCRRNVKNSRG